MDGSSPPTSLCVVVPCFNEAEVLEAFHRELSRVLAESGLAWAVYFVDDGSSDRTLEVLNGLAMHDERVRVCSLSRNFGHQIALSAGIDAASIADPDAVVVMDADLQHPPTLIPTLVQHFRSGSDVVVAVREETEGATFFKRASSRGFYRLFNALSDVKLENGAADFYLLSRRARRALTSMPERRRFLRGMVAWLGFPRTLVPYQASARVAGVSKYTLRKMVRFALDAIFAFSSAPIRLAVRFGVLVALLGTVYLAYVFGRYIAFGDLVEGWGSLMSVVLLLGGIQIAITGLIGEYVARIFDEAKQRPLYFLKQEPAPPVTFARNRVGTYAQETGDR